MNWPTQISYWTIGGFEGDLPIEKAFDICKQLACDLELSFGLEGAINPQTTEKECMRIRSLAAERNITLRTMASGVYWGQSLSDPRPDVRAQAVTFSQSFIQVASWLGLESILIIPGHVAVPWDETQAIVPYQKAWDLSTASIQELVPYAEKCNINLALENVWNWFLSDPMSMKLFVEQFKSERVGCYFDVANCLINGYPEHWIEILGGHIKAVHVKNFERTDCGGGISGFGESMNTGACNWPAIFAALENINYQGPLTAELIPFCRLPDLRLPDLELAQQGISELNSLLSVHSAHITQTT